MKPLIIEAKGDMTPAIKLDNMKDVFEISGWSHPEDAIQFYVPVFKWLNEYAETPNPVTIFHFHFQYFNTSSSKQIFRLISLLEEISKKSTTKIQWHYDSEDADMLTAGERYFKMSTLPFDFIPH